MVIIPTGTRVVINRNCIRERLQGGFGPRPETKNVGGIIVGIPGVNLTIGDDYSNNIAMEAGSENHIIYLVCLDEPMVEGTYPHRIESEINKYCGSYGLLIERSTVVVANLGWQDILPPH